MRRAYTGASGTSSRDARCTTDVACYHDAMSNPLLDLTGPPRFDAITPEHVVPGMRALLAELGAELERLEVSATPTWDGVVDPLERLGDRLGRTWGTVGHLMGVRNSDAMRAAHETVQP